MRFRQCEILQSRAVQRKERERARERERETERKRDRERVDWVVERFLLLKDAHFLLPRSLSFSPTLPVSFAYSKCEPRTPIRRRPSQQFAPSLTIAGKPTVSMRRAVWQGWHRDGYVCVAWQAMPQSKPTHPRVALASADWGCWRVAVGTLSELLEGIRSVIDALTSSMDSKITSVSSGCELFLRFITLKVTARPLTSAPLRVRAASRHYGVGVVAALALSRSDDDALGVYTRREPLHPARPSPVSDHVHTPAIGNAGRGILARL